MSETPADRHPGLNIQEILSWLPHRYPFLMIDRVIELEAGERAVAVSF